MNNLAFDADALGLEFIQMTLEQGEVTDDSAARILEPIQHAIEQAGAAAMVQMLAGHAAAILAVVSDGDPAGAFRMYRDFATVSRLGLDLDEDHGSRE